MNKIIFILMFAVLLVTACDGGLQGTPPQATGAARTAAVLTPTPGSSVITVTVPYTVTVPVTTTVVVTSTVVVPPAVVATPIPAVTTGCRDGEVVGNMANFLNRTPVGLTQNHSVVEVSWQPGTGFGGYNRFVLVVPKLEGHHQVFLTNVSTIHMVRYCGSLSEVENYAKNPGTHVNAMVMTAADSAGNMPSEEEIGVYTLNLGDGTLKVLKTAPHGPTIAEVRSHIEVVKVGSGAVVAPAVTPVVSGGVCPPATQQTIGWDGSNPPDKTVTGPVIANIGFPKEGTQQYRVLVPKGVTVTFLKVGGAYWQFADICSDAQLQLELNRSTGGLPIVNLDDLIRQGKARR